MLQALYKRRNKDSCPSKVFADESVENRVHSWLNTCAEASFLIECRLKAMNFVLKRDSSTGAFM